MGVRLGRVLAATRERIRPKLSQEALGARLGRGRVTVHNWESGKSTPSHADRLLLGVELNLDVHELNRLVELDRSDDPGVLEPASSPAVLFAQRQSALPLAARLWVQRFLTDLVAGGADDVEVENARTLLSAPALAGFLQGGAARAGQLTEPEIIGALEAIGDGAIRRILRRRGRNV
jgi:transcriptional regulator with XRE-family HTH domain